MIGSIKGKKMFESCIQKQNALKAQFAHCTSEELKYKKLIEKGKELSKLPPEKKVKENLVSGCQSIMYLDALYKNGVVYFSVESDALISAGLASILIDVYSGESPETILKCEPTFIEELGIGASLTPSRANGLYSIHLRMKQEALRLLMQNPTNK